MTNDLKKAVAEFDLILHRDPGNLRAQFNRTSVLFSSGNRDALAELKAILDRGGWQSQFAIDSAIVGHFAALRSNRNDEAHAILNEASAHGDKEAWPFPIVQYLRGEIDEPKLKATAHNDQLAEVHCCLGLEALQKGKIDRARSHFRKVKELNKPESTYFLIGLVELARLEKEHPADAGP